LINTSQQIGGAIGVAVATTIATTFTAHYVNAHPGSSPLGANALTLTVIVIAVVAQGLTTRFGVRPLLTAGMVISGASIVLYAQLPVHGHYFWNLFPAFLLSGLGLAFAFVPMSIGALAGVRHSEAGVASGLINTSQQIGGAIGVAVATTIATTFTAHYVNAHPGSNPLGANALTHGFTIAFYSLAAIAVVGALVAALLTESAPPAVAEEPTVLLEAA